MPSRNRSNLFTITTAPRRRVSSNAGTSRYRPTQAADARLAAAIAATAWSTVVYR